MSPIARLVNRAVHAGWRWVDRAGEIVPGTRAAGEFGSFGAGSCIDFPPATILGAGSIHLGSGTLVGRQVTLSVGWGTGEQVLPPRGLVIGDRCILGARTSITAHESIEIGDDVFCGQGVFVTDASHGYQVPDRPVGAQFGASDPVVVGAGSWIGHHAVLLPGTRLGRNVVVAAGSIVRGVVEDHAVVAGNPARVVRRYEPGVGWVGSNGDVRPVLADDLDGLTRAATG
ncbi:DapH/DapD/GlmU-related protein [Nocardioides sp. NPDC092400]|uniref:acyltransferase n=1 Tax=Nocardioides sp. NPDC092400 TaxID=3155196 RepID=UPI00342B774A